MSILSSVAARLLTQVGLFALGLVVRLLPWQTVFDGGQTGGASRVVFFGMDAWYHMRRLQMALFSGNGWPPSFDPYVNFPHGAQPIWPPLFDALLAGVVWPIHVIGDWSTVEGAAAVVPAVIGASCVVAIYRVGLRLFDPTVALVSGVGLAVLPGHFWYSQVGFVDHHAAIALMSTLLLAVGTRFVGPFADSPVRWRGAAALGALSGLSLLLWPGMLLHVGIVGVGFGFAWLASLEREAALRGALFLGLASTLALLLTGPAGWSAAWPGAERFSPVVISFFQPWLFASLGLLAAVAAFVFGRAESSAARANRTGQVAVLGLGLLVGSAFLFPDLLSGVGDAWRWLAKDEVFQGGVGESQPLFSSKIGLGETGLDVSIAEARLSRFVYLLPLALLALARHARARRRPDLWLLLWWTIALAAVTLMQRRFFNSLSPAFVLVVGWSVVTLFRSLWRSLPAAISRRPLARSAGWVALSLACVWLLQPSLATYRLAAANWMRVVRGDPVVIQRSQASTRTLLDAAEWLRDNTRPTDAPLDPNAAPEYGVLSHWGFGHLLKYVAQRPTVVGNFGDDVGEANLRKVTAYLASPEPDAVRILDDVRARYVLVETLGAVPPARLTRRSMRERLSVDDSPGWRHHRLLYESPIDAVRQEIGRSEFRIFERVAGARVVGRAAPGAVVRALLDYESNRGRRGRYEHAVEADALGRYEIVLPYATRGAPPGVDSAPAYRILSGGRAERLAVDEGAVQSGETLSGPDFSES
jgi:asparagine N-glycosylation enzyme membrane subunit Stt3